MQESAEKRKSVLVIEDDAFLVRAYEMRFAGEGIDTSIATTGHEVMPMLAKEPPNAIILDIVLPGGMNGFEVLEAIKRTVGWAKTPIIVVSNLSQETNILRAKELGANKYIIKADTKISDIISLTASHFC